MNTPVPIHPDLLRLAVFAALFAILALAEHRWPRRRREIGRSRRWRINLTIVGLDALAARLLLPVAPFALALQLQDCGWGLLPLLGLTATFEAAASLLALDLLIYTQHRLFHRLPLFWRLHRMHHTDLELDVSSGTRFHPVEILLSLLLKMAVVALLGIAPLSVLAFEILLNACSMWNHANLHLPPGLDRWLRLVLVTPDMHRVHHSILAQETHSNFGFNLAWWDRLFGSYTAQPRDGHEAMRLGLAAWRNQEDLGLWALLRLPLVPPAKRRTP
ncbi:sterol desaturase family protein [Desulfobulbus sp.]|uniref:sterol desaturase family protein n=1 Tax=Desulfobulbus sp. TaxID=895 RepID=UPI00286F40F1|nr:sterol desaturase family protein [Desulfobulbus sp.]